MADPASITNSDAPVSAEQQELADAVNAWSLIALAQPCTKQQDLVDTINALSLAAFAELFTCFTELPPELRMQIWKEVCHQARIVDVRVKFINHGQAIDQGRGENLYRMLSSNGIPAILSASREAREEGLKYYSPAFSTECVTSPTDPTVFHKSPPSAYVNWTIDTICAVRLPLNISSEEDLNNQYRRLCALYRQLGKYTTIKRLALDRGPYEIGGSHLRDLILNNQLEQIIVYATKPNELGRYTFEAYDPDRSELVREDKFLPDEDGDWIIDAFGVDMDNELFARFMDNSYNLLVERLETKEGEGDPYSYCLAFLRTCEQATEAEVAAAKKVSKGFAEYANWKKPPIAFMAMV